MRCKAGAASAEKSLSISTVISELLECYREASHEYRVTRSACDACQIPWQIPWLLDRNLSDP